MQTLIKFLLSASPDIWLHIIISIAYPIALGDSCDYTFKHWIMQTNYSIHYSIQNKRFFIHFGKRYSKWPKLKLGLALLSHFSTLYALLHIFVWQFYNFFLRMTHFFHLINNWFNFTKKIIHSTKYSFKEQMRYWPGLEKLFGVTRSSCFQHNLTPTQCTPLGRGEKG